MFREDTLTREFLVYLHMQDNAPQRVRLKLCDPICARDLLQQIGRQLVIPNFSMPQAVAARLSIPPSSYLFAFSDEENCFVPLNGKTLDEVMTFNRLLVHSFKCVSTTMERSNTVPSRCASSERDMGIDAFRCVDTSNGNGNKHQVHKGPKQLYSSSILPAGVEKLDERMGPRSSQSTKLDGANGTDQMQKGKGVSCTIEAMLQVVGFLLSEYAARATSDVVEPIEENIWVVVEDVLHHNGFSTAPPLYLPTVNAFMKTILDSLKTGRLHRRVGVATPLV